MHTRFYLYLPGVLKLFPKRRLVFPFDPFPLNSSLIQHLQLRYPSDSSDKDVAVMLVEVTIEANEESFVIVLQHGGNDVHANNLLIKSRI